MLFFLPFCWASEPKVQVENPFFYYIEDGKKKIKSSPYRERRSKWGTRLGFGVSLYESSEGQFERDGTPFFAEFGLNRNFQFFSLGAEVGALSMTLEAAGGTEVDVLGFSGGLFLFLDGLFSNPWVVPFGGGGVMTISGESDVGDVETDEDIVPYFKAGFLIQLNWLDRATAGMGYYNYGLENTFMIVQVRQISSTSDTAAVDFESDPIIEAGIQLEF